MLRELEVLSGPFPRFDPDTAAETPEAEFDSWLQLAVRAGVPEPHAMTVSTVDGEGSPDARVLLLKDLDDRGWQFATSSTSAKGRELSSNPRVCLTFYWPSLGRQVRVRGEAVDLGSEAAAIDFQARSRGSRLMALLERQSQVLDSAATLAAALEELAPILDLDPNVIAPSWTLFLVIPSSVEFWQGDRERRHTRLEYKRTLSGWTRYLLWP